jgi:hypothetical protein
MCIDSEEADIRTEGAAEEEEEHSGTELTGCAIDPMCATKMVRNVELLFSTP